MKKIKGLPVQVSGGALDDHIPPQARAIIAGVKGDQDAMAESIRHRIGWFRMFRESRQTEPQTQQLTEHLQEIATAASFVGEAITSLPLDADAIFHDKVWRLGGEQYLSPRDLQHQLFRVVALMKYTAEKIEPRGKGKKTALLEHQLLSDVAEIIEEHSSVKLGKVEIAGIAAQIVSHVCLVPTDPKKARASIRKTRANRGLE